VQATTAPQARYIGSFQTGSMLPPNRYIHIYSIFACLAAVSIDLTMAILMDRQSLLTTTISDLAAGDYATAQDFGLILVAVAIALTGLVIWRMSSSVWSKGAAGLFMFAGPLIVFISLYEQYSKQTPSGPLLHFWAVGAIGISLAVALGLIAWQRGSGRPWFRWGTAVAAIIFLASGSATFGVSNEIIGLVERFAAASLTLWLLAFHGGHLATDDNW